MQLVFPGQALFRRELNQTLRNSRYYSFMAIALCCFTAVVITTWPDAKQQYNPQYMTNFSTDVVRGLSSLIAFLVCLLVPAIAGSSISLERENETYDMLYMTQVRPFWVVFAKLTTSLGVIVLCAVAMLPVAGAVFFLVGVSWTEFLMDYVIIALLALACGAAAICASAFFRRTVIAMAVSYTAMLAIIGLIFPFLMLVTELFSGSMRAYNTNQGLLGGASYDITRAFFDMMEALSKLTPLYLLFGDLLNASGTGIMTPNPGIVTYAICIAALLSVAFYAYWLAVWRVAQCPVERNQKQTEPIDNTVQLHERRKKFPYYLIDPHKRKAMIPDRRNPMMVKELRWGLLGELSRLTRIFYVSLMFSIFILCGLFMNASIYNTAASTRSAMLIMMSLNLLLLPALLANILTKEHEQGNMDMLRMTLISPRDVILGKLTAGFLTMLPFYFATLFASSFIFIITLFIWHDYATSWIIAQGLITLFVVMFFTVSLTLLVSACTRNTQTAIILSYILSLLALFGGFLLVMFWIESLPAIRNLLFNQHIAKIPRETYQAWLQFGSTFSPMIAYFEPVSRPHSNENLLFWYKSIAIFSIASVLLTTMTTMVFKYSKTWSQ